MKSINLRLFILTVITLQFIACGKSDDKSNSQANSAKQDSLNLKLDIKTYTTVKLSMKADSLSSNWPMYNTLKNEVERMQDYTIQDVISNVMSIEKAADSLQKTIPKPVDTLSVQSRINVLNTKAKFLLLLCNKQQPKLEKIKSIAEEYPKEFNALNIQLNEVFIELPEFDMNN